MMTCHDLVVTKMGLRFMGRQFPCSIGHGGIVAAGDKREGDGASPAGYHNFIRTFYNPARVAPPTPWAIPITPADCWSDDPKDPNYNHLVRLPHSFSHERLWRADPLYDIFLATDWNWPKSQPGKGSAIFMHIWRRPRYPTTGCIAMKKHNLLWVIARIIPQSRLIIQEGH